MNALLSGILIAEYAIIALFFLRFWTKSKDCLFFLFAIAFAILAAQRFTIAMTREIFENQAALYLVRLAAFVVIIVGVVDKNRR